MKLHYSEQYINNLAAGIQFKNGGARCWCDVINIDMMAFEFLSCHTCR